MPFAPAIVLSMLGLGGGLPQLWNLRSPAPRKRLAAAATAVFCGIFTVDMIYVAFTLPASGTNEGGISGIAMVLSALAALGSWTAGLLWAGPATNADRASWLGAAGAVALFILAAFAGIIQ